MRVLSGAFITEKQKLASRPIRLYIVEGGQLGVEVLRYAEWTENIVYNSQTYYAAPIKNELTTENLASEIDSITISIGNIDRAFIAYLEHKDGLRNCKITIRTVFVDLLDDNTAFTDDIFYVASAVLSQSWVVFTLKSKLDLLEVELPNRRFYRNTCQWGFKSTECGYAGVASTCNHTSIRCEELGNLVRFGGFPGTGASIWKVNIS